MSRKVRILSAIITVVFSISLIGGCSSKAVEAAKQIESSIQEREAKVKGFNNINAADINEQNAMDIIKELSSEKYKGRKAGTKENEAAMAYVAEQFRAMSLKSPDGLENYMQYYNQPSTLLKESPKLEILDGRGNTLKSFDYPKNFVFRVLSDSTEDINIKAPMKVMESTGDIAKQSFRSNEVLLFPIKSQGRQTILQLLGAMYDTNASAIIVEMDVDSENARYSDLIVPSLNNGSWGGKYKPVINVDSATFAALAQAVSENKIISLQCRYEVEQSVKTANIVGYIPGSDEKLKNEYIIISGHLDHVGDNLNGTYNPGAFDNASGSAAMMEIAKVVSESKVKPKKTIVFIDFNGEEEGLLGSAYYAADPVFPLKNTVMINLDMVGSKAQIPLSVAAGRDQVLDLKLEFLEMAKTLGIDAIESSITASDHFSLGEKGVPTVMLSHMDDKSGYHSPEDTLGDIDSKRLRQVIELVLHYIDVKAY